MANTPTRRPPNYPSGRRMPEGTRPVARKSEVDRTRQHLETAAQIVQSHRGIGGPEVAETLRKLAGPFGHRMLVQDRDSDRVPAGTTNLAISVPERLRKQIQDAAVDSADSPSAKVTDLLSRVLSERIPQVLSGKLTPREIPREPRGSGVKKVNLNVPVDSALLERLRGQLPELGERLGFELKATAAGIGFRLLLDEYGLEYETSQNQLADTQMLQLYLPPRLAEEITARLDKAEMIQALNEGYAKALAGEWTPYPVPKAARGSEFARVRLVTHADSNLVDRVRTMAPQLSEALGFRVTPQSLAIDYLISELGLEDLADAEYGPTGG
ncbi:MAG: hypothetical protein HOY79_04550 [Streptomyces sp.]|nr:hypothetical protein [Streptomyces sp.]NUS24066.1 hypothetical protein [Streptomyces sp.]